MKKLLSVFVVLYLILLSGCSSKIESQTKILVYTRNGEGFVHDNIQASIDALIKAGQENGIIVDASDDPSFITEENLRQYNCIVLSNTNNETFDTDEQKLAFVRYIHAGGGIAGIHSACGSERQWPWFWSMLGGKFERHPPFQQFDIKIINHNHPSTEFFGDIWEWEDECYYLKHLNPSINVLIAADLRTIEDEQKTDYPGEVFGNYFPLAWNHEFEGGRVFYTALGHSQEHYSDPDLIKHILGGIKWAIGDGSGPDYTNVNTSEIPE